MDDLIKKIKQGDKKSATDFVKLFYDDIYMYVLKLTLNKDLSYDLTQEIFVRALNKINTFKHSSQNIKSWLYRIAHNYVMTYFKYSKKVKQSTNEILDIIPSNTDLEKEYILNEDSRDIFKKVNKLEPIYKEIIILRFYQDLSIKEISSILKLNENTVKTRLSRGLNYLKAYFERGDYNEYQ